MAMKENYKVGTKTAIKSRRNNNTRQAVPMPTFRENYPLKRRRPSAGKPQNNMEVGTKTAIKSRRNNNTQQAVTMPTSRENYPLKIADPSAENTPHGSHPGMPSNSNIAERIRTTIRPLGRATVRKFTFPQSWHRNCYKIEEK